MNLDNTTKAKILFSLNLLSGLNINGYKFESYNSSTDELVFSNGSETYKLLSKELNNKNVTNSDTSELNTEQNKHKNPLVSDTSEINGNETSISEPIVDVTSEQNFYSDTSDISGIKSQSVLKGGSKNIFKSSKYSDTSSIVPDAMSNYSNTSAFSQYGQYAQHGGNFETSDTLNSISDLKERKSNSKSSGSRINLDIGIFKKNQSGGGSTNDVNLKKKMQDIGINSSSTSSICE